MIALQPIQTGPEAAVPRPAPPLFIHIPTPGDHYSPATGSAIATVISRLANHHAETGGQSLVIVNRGTRHDYPIGRCIEVRGHPYPNKWQKAIDFALARIGLERFFGDRLYRPHIAAIDPEFAGPVFVYNAPVGVRLARRFLPKARICLWAQNDLFRVYKPREVHRVAAAADHMICCSQFIADQQTELLPPSLRSKVCVVPNGVDADMFTPAPLPRPAGPPVILFVGRVNALKGPDLLIQAAIKLAQRGLDFRLRIVGSKNFSAADPLTPFELSLRALAKPISDKIEFSPFLPRDEIVRAYQAADINVVPSNWDEPFGLTVLEGLACGLPSVLSHRGGIPQAAADAALYFTPPNVDQLADQLAKLITDPSARAHWAAKARQRALEMTWQHSYAKLNAILNFPEPPPQRPFGDLIHIPTPGDHYSLATGSATMSVVHELTRRHISAGSGVRIIVGRETLHDIPDGRSVEVDFLEQRTLTHRAVDAILGRIGLPRWFERSRYRPALRAIDSDFSGAILIYNGPGVIALFKKHCPKACVCLYAVNALFRTFSRAETRRVVAQADRVIVCSQFIADDLFAALGRHSMKVKVVHNGVDTRSFIPPPAGRNSETPTILFIGRATPQKGPDLLLKAAQLLAAQPHPFRIRIVGSRGFAPTKDMSPYELLLRNLAEPIKDRVQFQPSISRSLLLEEYQNADIFCAPSNWDDPFPLTVLEAQACGLPVVTSRRGGIPEASWGSLALFSPPDTAELAERLGQLVRDANERSVWGARGRARAEKLDWDNQYLVLCHALE